MTSQIASFTTNAAAALALAERLSEALDPERCAVSIYENGADWVVDAVFSDPADRASIERIVGDSLGADARDALSVSAVVQRDWVAASLEGLAPVAAGRFVIHGSHDRGRLRPNQTGIEIEAALAFGTGHHGTTRGCLLTLEDLRKRSAGRHLRVLDVGTGSGVLAIAAALAFRTGVLASDIDPIAAAVARDNARRNKAGGLVHTIAAAGVGALSFRLGGPYDLIFANILEGPLRRMSHPLARLLAPDGRLVLSGLLPAHAAGVISAYRTQGIILESRRLTDGWVTLVMRRRANAKRPG